MILNVLFYELNVLFYELYTQAFVPSFFYSTNNRKSAHLKVIVLLLDKGT